MKAKQNISSYKEAKKIDLVEYPSTLCFKPVKIKGNAYWYPPPLQDEKIPGFKIDRKISYWCGYRIMKGDNLVDFGSFYFNCSSTNFLHKLTGNFFLQHPVKEISNKQIKKNISSIPEEFILSSSLLTNCLAKRKIPYSIPYKYCREVRNQMNDEIFYGIVFKTDSVSFEIRNTFLKFTSSTKSTTTFKNGGNEIAVFEGLFDFLSYKVLAERNSMPGIAVTLNSPSFFENSAAVNKNYSQVILYLDVAKVRQNCSRLDLTLSNKYNDESNL